MRILDEPRPLPKRTPVGCCRPPWMWERIYPAIEAANDAKSLSIAWDLLLSGLENEILDMHDVVGKDRLKHSGRGGQPELKWVKQRWKPPRRRPQRTDLTKAWEWAGAWAKHARRAQASITRQVQGGVKEGMSDVQRKKLVDSMLDLQNSLVHGSRNPKRLQLATTYCLLIEMGMNLFKMDDWEG